MVNTAQQKLGPLKILIFISFLVAHSSRASEFRSPRAAALGGAGHANPLLNDSVYQNPSFASFLPVYSWAANYRSLGEDQGRAYSLSILDGRSEFVQASAAYGVRDDLSSVFVGLSRKLQPKLTVGLGAKLFYTKRPARFRDARNWNLSATAAPWDWLQVAVIIDNMVQSTRSRLLGLEREAIVGTKFKITEKFLIYLDPRIRIGNALEIPDNPSLGYEAGAEIAIMKDLYVRMGSFRNVPHPDLRTKARGFGYGLGWVVPRMSFDYALERVVGPLDRLTHNWGVTLYF